MADEGQPDPEEDKKPKLADVLAGPPFGETCEISLGAASAMPRLPPVVFHCQTCEQPLIYDGDWAHTLPNMPGHQGAEERRLSTQHQVAVFKCRHCRKHVVTVPLKLTQIGSSFARFTVMKIGQHPKYGPRIPKRVQRFLDAGDWDLYRKGWGAEHQNFGIGAYAYYRRVVEHVWAKLLDRLIAAAKRTGDADIEAELQKSKGNWKFEESVNAVMPAVPKKLMIKTNNPLTLLHDAFSDGVHNLDDATCLERAKAGRFVLEKLLALMHEVLEDEQNLDQSIAVLQKSRARPKPAAT